MGISESRKYIKYINFDLDTKQLLKIFPDSTREPYTLIKKFFEDRGFEHRQYSGYISKEPLSKYRVEKLAEELGETFTWLNTCMQKIDVSNIMGEASIMEQVAYGAKKQKQLKQLSHTKNNNAEQNTKDFSNTSTISQNTTSTQPTTKTNHTITPQAHKPKARRR